MKKLITILASLIAVTAFAHGSSHPPVTPDPQTTNIVNWNYAQRVLHFASDRNTMTPDGMMLVCFGPNETSYKDVTCLNKNGQNQWTDVSTIQIPGFELMGFEYRFIGTGYRNLILYFGKK